MPYNPRAIRMKSNADIAAKKEDGNENERKKARKTHIDTAAIEWQCKQRLASGQQSQSAANNSEDTNESFLSHLQH